MKMETLKEEENHFKNFDSPCNINNNNKQQQQEDEEDEELKPIADTDALQQQQQSQQPSHIQQPQSLHQHNEELNKVTNSPNPLSVSVSSSLGSPSSIQLAPQGTIGNYLVIKTIGRGQFGKVKLGYHKKIPNEKVAIKIINKGKLDPETLKMVQREVRIMKLLHHPNIIRLYEVIETNRALYLIMEYAGEGEVMDFMIAHGVLTELQARTFFTQIVSAINYCHSKKAVHRDLKPENLLLDLNRQIKIIDFGLSNVFTPGSYLKTFCGSPTYASPELILRKEYNGPSVDVWSMGVVLFVLVTGYLPFDGDNYVELFQKILAGDYTIPAYLTNDCKSLISRMLVVDPDKRATMEEIINHPWLSTTKQIILSTTMSNSLNNLNSCLDNNGNGNGSNIKTTSDVTSMLSSNSNSSSNTTLPPPQSPSATSSRNEEPLDQEIIEELVGLGFEKEELCNSIRQNKYNDAASTYFLLQGKKQRESQQNQIEHAKKLEKFYAETLSIQPPVGENSPLIKYKRHHKRSNTVDSPKSSTSTSAHRNNHNRHSQHQPQQQQQTQNNQTTQQQQQQQQQVVNNNNTTTTTTATTTNTSTSSNTPNSAQSSSINSNNSSVNPSPLCLSNAVPVSLRDKLKEKETFSTSSNNSSNQSINSGSSSPPSTSPTIQPFSLTSNHIQRRATASSLQHQSSSSSSNNNNNNNSNNNSNNKDGSGGNIITRRLRSNSSSVADQSQRQESRKLEDDWVIFEDYSNERESKNNHLGGNHGTNSHIKKQKSPMHSFLSSFKNILKRSDDKSFTNPHNNSGGSISTSNTPRSSNNNNLIGGGSGSGSGNNEDNSSNTASPNVISAATTTTSATSSSNNTTVGEPRIVRFVFGVNTTTMKDAPELMQQVLKVVDTFCIPHTKKAPYLIECETEGVRFSIEICRLPRLSVNGLKFKRIGGSSWRYKSICKDLLSQMKLNSQ